MLYGCVRIDKHRLQLVYLGGASDKEILLSLSDIIAAMKYSKTTEFTDAERKIIFEDSKSSIIAKKLIDSKNITRRSKFNSGELSTSFGIARKRAPESF